MCSNNRLAGLDRVVELFHPEVGGFANKREIRIVCQRGSVVIPARGIVPIFLLLVELGNALSRIDPAGFRFGFFVEVREEVVDHLLAANDAGLLLERDRLVLVFDEISVGCFLLVPSAALHRRSRSGILGSLHGDEIAGTDRHNFQINFCRPRGVAELHAMTGEFMHRFNILR